MLKRCLWSGFYRFCSVQTSILHILDTNITKRRWRYSTTICYIYTYFLFKTIWNLLFTRVFFFLSFYVTIAYYKTLQAYYKLWNLFNFVNFKRSFTSLLLNNLVCSIKQSTLNWLIIRIRIFLMEHFILGSLMAHIKGNFALIRDT